MTPREEVRVLLAMVLSGAALGMVYDGLWMLRKAFFPGKAALAVTDILFGLICALGVIGAALLLRVNALRLYILCGVLGGMILQQMSAGVFLRIMMQLVKKMAKTNGK